MPGSENVPLNVRVVPSFATLFGPALATGGALTTIVPLACPLPWSLSVTVTVTLKVPPAP